jgi:hypothetical protein
VFGVGMKCAPSVVAFGLHITLVGTCLSWPRQDQINWPLQHDTLQDHPFGEAALPWWMIGSKEIASSSLGDQDSYCFHVLIFALEAGLLAQPSCQVGSLMAYPAATFKGATFSPQLCQLQQIASTIHRYSFGAEKHMAHFPFGHWLVVSGHSSVLMVPSEQSSFAYVNWR